MQCHVRAQNDQLKFIWACIRVNPLLDFNWPHDTLLCFIIVVLSLHLLVLSLHICTVITPYFRH